MTKGRAWRMAACLWWSVSFDFDRAAIRGENTSGFGACALEPAKKAGWCAALPDGTNFRPDEHRLLPVPPLLHACTEAFDMDNLHRPQRRLRSRTERARGPPRSLSFTGTCRDGATQLLEGLSPAFSRHVPGVDDASGKVRFHTINRATPDNVVSIMEALRKSVEMEKKGRKPR